MTNKDYNSKMTSVQEKDISETLGNKDILKEIMDFAKGSDLAYFGIYKGNSSKIFRKGSKDYGFTGGKLPSYENNPQGKLLNDSYEKNAKRYFQTLNSLRKKEE